MKKQIRNQKGFSPIVAIVVGVVVVIIALSVLAIQSSSDLNTVASDLDNTDMSQFDKELNRLDSDISSF